METSHIKNPFALIVFGASGDLAKLKIFPAFYALAKQKRLPKEYYIIGFARTQKSQEEFKKEFVESIKNSRQKNTKIEKNLLDKLSSHLHYFTGQYNQIHDFKKFKTYLKEITKNPAITKLAYFSVPPIAFNDIIKNLGETKNSPQEDIRLIIEKPFGLDQKSAEKLFHFTARYFEEEQVYLLDHYLGKSAVQSILNLRHSNRLLNLMMKGPEIANIQITAEEKIGVKNRANYFDQVGIIKDMIQSHLLQILALITMSIPITENFYSIHREKYSILSALQFIKSKKNIVLGQYKSYHGEKDIPKNSHTETFAALRLFIDRESWYKVPIYIRTGKKMDKKDTCAVIEIKKFAFQPKEEQPNRLIIELQPDEKITIRLVNKHGHSSEYQTISTSDSIACIGDECLPEHSLLLLDVLKKNRTHFLSFQEIIASWKLIDSIIDFIKKNKIRPEIYKDNSSGPTSQNILTEHDNFTWYDIH